MEIDPRSSSMLFFNMVALSWAPPSWILNSAPDWLKITSICLGFPLTYVCKCVVFNVFSIKCCFTLNLWYLCYCACVCYHFDISWQSNIFHLGVESIYDPYITLGQLGRYCACVLDLFNARGRSTTSLLFLDWAKEYSVVSRHISPRDLPCSPPRFSRQYCNLGTSPWSSCLRSVGFAHAIKLSF